MTTTVAVLHTVFADFVAIFQCINSQTIASSTPLVWFASLFLEVSAPSEANIKSRSLHRTRGDKYKQLLNSSKGEFKFDWPSNVMHDAKKDLSMPLLPAGGIFGICAAEPDLERSRCDSQTVSINADPENKRPERS